MSAPIKSNRWKLSEDTGINFELEYHKTWHQAVTAFWKKFKRTE